MIFAQAFAGCAYSGFHPGVTCWRAVSVAIGIVNSLFEEIFDTPKTSGYVLLDRRCEVVRELSYERLVQVSRQRAAELNAMLPGAPVGSVVALVFNDPLQFVTALFACVYLGLTVLPVAPRQVRRLASRLKMAGSALIVVERALLPSLLPGMLPGIKGALEGVPVLGWSGCAPRGMAIEGAGGVRPAPQSEHETALMQLSSGTTGEPNVVELSPGNICSNERVIARHFGHSCASKVLGWLPHTHDMGLFGTLLQPFFVDCVGFLARPNDFVREPLSWLRGISRHAVTTSGAPTFAYALCTRDSGSIEELDLSSWNVAFVGAEPVHPGLLSRFCDRFGVVGFDAKALMPCYGLAEAVLFVTGERRGAGLQTIRAADGLVRGLNLVTSEAVCVGSIGKPGTTRVRLRRAGELRAAHPGDCVGEILVAGPSVTAGGGVARTDDGWVATGDLGLLRGGRLYVCARLKDVVKVRGRSVSLAEIDQCVGATLADPTIHVCSFESRQAGGSCAVWVALQSNHDFIACDELFRRVDAEVLAQLGVSIRLLAFPPRPRRIVRTASGKLNRIATRNACLLAPTAVV